MAERKRGAPRHSAGPIAARPPRPLLAGVLALAAVEAFVDFPWSPAGPTGQLAFGEPVEVIRADCLAEVRPALAAVRRAAMAGRYAVGYLSYEAAPAFDPAMRVRAGSRIPLVWFGIHDGPQLRNETRRPTAYACSLSKHSGGKGS